LIKQYDTESQTTDVTFVCATDISETHYCSVNLFLCLITGTNFLHYTVKVYFSTAAEV